MTGQRGSEDPHQQRAGTQNLPALTVLTPSPHEHMNKDPKGDTRRHYTLLSPDCAAPEAFGKEGNHCVVYLFVLESGCPKSQCMVK